MGSLWIISYNCTGSYDHLKIIIITLNPTHAPPTNARADATLGGSRQFVESGLKWEDCSWL